MEKWAGKAFYPLFFVTSFFLFIAHLHCHKQEHLKVIHEAHTETLELQVLSLRFVQTAPVFFSLTIYMVGFFLAFRKDLSFSQRECEELKVRLSQREKEAAEALRAGGAPCVAGLCLTCAQQHAVSADSQTNQHVQTISKLKKSVETYTRLNNWPYVLSIHLTLSVKYFRDYDELLAALCAAKASQQEAQQKERAACLQVKQAVQMVEEAKLCRAKVRFKEDLPNSSSQTLLFWPAFILRICVCADGVAVWADVQRAGPTQAAVRAGTSGFA